MCLIMAGPVSNLCSHQGQYRQYYLQILWFRRIFVVQDMGLAACGSVSHGKKASTAGAIGACYACGRPGARDFIGGRWRHVGNSHYWADITEWSAKLGESWVFERDFGQEPLVYGECICSRSDCVDARYKVYRNHREKQEKGSLDIMQVGQRSRTGRYPTLGSQVSENDAG